MTPVDTTYTFSAHVAFIYPTLSQKTCLFLPSATRTFEDCSRDARMNQPITAQQRTYCHAAAVQLLTSSRVSLQVLVGFQRNPSKNSFHTFLDFYPWLEQTCSEDSPS
ncbi:hypothetical protein Y032_0101g3397 [Ancylostoma ceylanicum]|uniref:Uncharacterized protein n=1 Tax=Ancylostoma ceylanicum TaxID=53326 RepID=A0A016THV0_9BILA|nr:hypothetical protein Y032_0101g3397 [Ancylostoma ceylanicum]